MTSLALADTNGRMSLLEPQLADVRKRVRSARDFRRVYMEPGWQLNLAFASGKHWVGWHPQTRTLRAITELDPRYRGRELITADVITEYRTTALGELGSDNDRPELQLARDDTPSEAYQAQTNRALAYAWEMEFDGDDCLAQVDRFVVDLGTAAVRCRYDSTQGPVAADNVPHLNGRPVLNPQDAMALMQQGPNPDVTMGAIKTGRICWEPLSAFNILAPPGASHEKQFPWEGVIRPAYLPDVKEMYGGPASELTEDGDISTSLGISVLSPTLSPATYSVTDGKSNRLRDHVWLTDYYERPTQKYPYGRQLTLASNDLKLLDYKEQLPYQAPDGTWRSGIAYFHWWRVTGRFWSRALMDVLKDGQRGINKRRSQINEIIDRNMPYVIVETGSKAKRRQGLVNEMVEIDPNERAPQPIAGIGPGPWMQGDVEALREDLQHASGISGPRRGENPQNVTTYSQLALINELDTSKREPIYLERKRSIMQLVEDTIYDIRTYWGPNKQIMLAGEDDQLDVMIYDATKIPAFFIVKIGKGSAKPRSQAAELQKITDIWNAAALATAVQQNPNAWIDWYKNSIEAGEALDLPASSAEDPVEKAEIENYFMTERGTPMPIAYYDNHALHLPRHRKAQDQAMFQQNMQLWQIIENHCQLHMNAAMAQAEQQMQQAALPPGRSPIGPTGPPPMGPGPGGVPQPPGPGQASPPRAPGVPSPPVNR